MLEEIVQKDCTKSKGRNCVVDCTKSKGRNVVGDCTKSKGRNCCSRLYKK